MGDDRLPNYVHGACPNCGRHRLMPHFEEREIDGERDHALIGIECEKCYLSWPMNYETGQPTNPYGAWPHPITKEEAR